MMACRLVLCGSSLYAQKNWSCSEAVDGFAEDLSVGKDSGCTISVTTRERMLEGLAKLIERRITFRSWTIEIRTVHRMVVRH